jgi:hypothetical protein
MGTVEELGARSEATHSANWWAVGRGKVPPIRSGVDVIELMTDSGDGARHGLSFPC